MVQSRQVSIVDVSTADPPLAFARSARSRVIAALWTSLVAWSSTVRWTRGPGPPEILQTAFVLLTHGAVERSHVALVPLEFTSKPGQRLMVPLVLMLPLFERSLCHLALATLCGRSCLASARWAFSSGHSVRPAL